jgi:hypothetical protein
LYPKSKYRQKKVIFKYCVKLALSSHYQFHNLTKTLKTIKMKGLILAAFSLFLFGTTNAQDGDGDDDAMITSNSDLNGHPIPGHHMHLARHWSDFTTISISPFQYSENGVGVGLSYERALDPDGIISAYLPVIATFNLKKDYPNGYYNYNGSYYQNQGYTNNNVMFYAMPGVKFYPTGMGKVKYAVGPNAVIGVGQKAYDDSYMVYDQYGSGYMTTSYGVYDRFLLGMMINNSLNISATPHLYIGAEMGFGFTYFDRVNSINRGVNFLTQGSFKIGYTF